MTMLGGGAVALLLSALLASTVKGDGLRFVRTAESNFVDTQDPVLRLTFEERESGSPPGHKRHRHHRHHRATHEKGIANVDRIKNMSIFGF